MPLLCKSHLGSVAEEPTVTLFRSMVSLPPKRQNAGPMQLQRETVITGHRAEEEGEGRLCTYLEVLVS